MRANYHTHTLYCDGKNSIEEMVREASRLQFQHLGFSSHAPLPIENDFAIREEEIRDYLRDIEDEQAKHPSITLFKSLECDFIPGLSHPFRALKEQYKFDYLIGGVHLVAPPDREGLWFIDGSLQTIYDEGLEQLFDRDARKGVTRFWEQTFEMIETEDFEIIAHLDKIKMHNKNRYFREDELWYRVLADHALHLIQQKGVILEVNTRGIYKGRCPDLYPSDYIIRQAARKKIPVVISADAHKTEELDLLRNETEEKLKALGVKEIFSFPLRD